MKERRKKEARQLTLTEQSQQTPCWTMLPEDCRREVVTLLAKLLRSEELADGEASDE